MGGWEFDAESLRLLWQVWRSSVVIEAVRYGGVALLLWGGVHGLLRRRLAHRVIAGWPRAADLRREIAYSLLSIAVFAGLSLGIVALIWSGHFVIYRDPARYGWTWLLLSLPLMLVFHDTYFYWTHRLLHALAVPPFSWRAPPLAQPFALGRLCLPPGRGLDQRAGHARLILWAVPVHGGVLLLFSLHQIIRNAHGHLSIEILPRGFAATGWVGISPPPPTTTCTTRAGAAISGSGSPGGIGVAARNGPTIWRVSRPPRAARGPAPPDGARARELDFLCGARGGRGLAPSLTLVSRRPSTNRPPMVE
jgi:hypothetical protein